MPSVLAQTCLYRVQVKITTIPRLFSEHLTQIEKKTSDYECTHEAELFDTYFV